MFTYNKQFMTPPLDATEINTLIGSLDSKEYNYKCKDEPIHSFCDAKKCALQQFGVGDNAPTPNSFNAHFLASQKLCMGSSLHL